VALPSAVTLGSLAFVIAAGGGYVALAAASANPAAAPDHHVVSPSLPSPEKPISVPQHSTTPHHVRPAVPDVLIEIYNNNGITGQAEQAAATLQGAGWNVSATDNWYGNIPADTVYYPLALHDEAVKLAKVLHITRLHAAVAPMKFDRLTVIIATS
jgi:LytR cell envelope-related transcriptional attenuator